MPTNVFKDLIKKISLTPEQVAKADKHFMQVKGILNELGIDNVTVQGSFSRKTIIQGMERWAEGFDIDIAAVVSITDVNKLRELDNNIWKALRESEQYSKYKNHIVMGPKAINIEIDHSFSIDVTIVIQDPKRPNTEQVWNSELDKIQESGSLMFIEQYLKTNEQSTDNSQRDLSKAYKHIKESVANNILVPTIVLDILVSKNEPKNKKGYVAEMIDTLNSIDRELRTAKKDESNYTVIQNPAYDKDFIATKLFTISDLNNLIILNSVVKDFVQNTLIENKPYDDLGNKFFFKAHEFYKKEQD